MYSFIVEREKKKKKFKAVSNTVWVCLKAVIIEKDNKKRNEHIEVTFHNNYNYITTTLLLRRFLYSPVVMWYRGFRFS